MDNRSTTAIFRNKFKQIGLLIIIATILGTGIGCEEEDDTSGTPPAPTAATKVDTGVSLATKSSNDLIDLSEVSCDKLEELEKRADFADITFGYYEFDQGDALVQSVMKTLQKEYLGDNYEEKKDDNDRKTTYSVDKKKIEYRTTRDKGAVLGYTYRYTPEDTAPKQTKEATLTEVQKLIVNTLKLGEDKDFYIPEIEEIENANGAQLQANGPGGSGSPTPNNRFRQVDIHRVLSGLSFSPRLAMARVVYAMDGTLVRFVFGGGHAGKQLGTIKGSELVKVGEAESKVKDMVRAASLNPDEYTYRCSINYSVNRKKDNIGTMLAPVYEFEVKPKNDANANGMKGDMHGLEHVQFPATNKEEVTKAFKGVRF